MLIKLCKLSEARIDRAWNLHERLLTDDVSPHCTNLHRILRRALRARSYAMQARKCLTLLHYQQQADALNRLRCGGAL